MNNDDVQRERCAPSDTHYYSTYYTNNTSDRSLQVFRSLPMYVYVLHVLFVHLSALSVVCVCMCVCVHWKVRLGWVELLIEVN